MLWWTLRQLESSNAWTRADAAKKLGNSGNTKAVEPLISALKDSNEDVRREAAEALGKIGDARGVEPLIVALMDSHEDVRYRAVKALKALRYEPADETQQAMIFVANKEWDDAIRLGAVAVEPLIAGLKDRNDEVRWRVAEAFGEIGDASAVPVLIGALKDSDKYLHWRAAEALAKIGDASAVPALVAALKDSDRDARLMAASALVEIGDASAVPALVAALKDSDKYVRRSTAEGIGRVGRRAAEVSGKIGRPAVSALVAALVAALKDSDSDVRWSAATTLGWIGDVSAVPALVAVLKGTDSNLCERATEALVKIGGPAVPALSNALTVGDSDVRQRNGEALGQIGDVSAIESLVSCLESEQSNDVRRDTVAALENLVWTPSKPIRQSLWALKDFPGVGKTVTCSTDCSRVAVVRSLGDPQYGFDAEYAVVDGRPYPKARRITPNAQIPVVQFSCDGKLWGYSAVDDEGNEFAVINGSESHHYAALVHPSFLFDLSMSEVGGHCAFGARREGASFYVIDGQETDPADDVDDFRWTRDGSRCLFIERRGDVKRVVVDGSAGPSYADISFPCFSQDGRKFMYEARVGEEVVAVSEHVEVGTPCEAIESLRCGPSPFGVCYWARSGGFAELRVAGDPSGVRVPVKGDYSHGSYDWQVEISPDGRHIAAAGKIEYGKHSVFLDNQLLGHFGFIGNLAYDSASRLLFLAGPSYKECYLHIDGKPASDDCGFAEFLHAAPLGGRYCFQSVRNDTSCLVVDGRRSTPIYPRGFDFRLIKFSPPGTRVSYVGKRGSHEYIVADELECGPFDTVVGTSFTDDDVLIGTVVNDEVVERLEWRLDNPQ